MLRLEVSPPQLTDARTQWLDHSQPEHWRLYRLDGELGRLVALVDHGLAVPRGGARALLDAISQLAPLLPIHSDLTDLAGQLPALPADATLYALLLRRRRQPARATARCARCLAGATTAPAGAW